MLKCKNIIKSKGYREIFGFINEQNQYPIIASYNKGPNDTRGTVKLINLK